MLREKNVALADTIVSRTEPYFSCSPDGIDSQTNLWIKCPTKSVTVLNDSGKYDLISNNGQFILKPKGTNGYYTHVRLAMYCTGAKLCKCYVWCSDPKERVCIDVPYDKVFLNEIISNARQFYF